MDRLLRTSQTSKNEIIYTANLIKLPDNVIIEVLSAEYVADYKLLLRFNDGKERIIDFEHFLRNSLNPMIRVYLDLDRFKNFSVEYGDLLWNDYDLCFPVADLYEGEI